MTVRTDDLPPHPAAPAPSASTAVSHSPQAAFKQPALLRLYFLLAAFNVLTLGLGLFLNFQLIGIYNASMASNAQWAARGDLYQTLGTLARRFEDAGRNVFQSRDQIAESTRLAQARRNLDEQMTAVRADLAANVPEPARSRLGGRLDRVAEAVQAMKDEVATVFTVRHGARSGQASARNAAMERSFQQAGEALDQLRLEVGREQRQEFVRQSEAARQLRLVSALFVAMVLVMVVAAAFHGRRLVRQAAQQFASVQATQAMLAEQARQVAEAEHLAALGHWVWTLADDSVQWSDQLYRLFGFAPAGCIPSARSFVERVHPDDRARVAAWGPQCLRDRAPSAESRFRLLRADGAERHMLAHVRTVLDAAGDPVSVHGTVQDVTEQEQQAQELRRAKEVAEDASRSKSAFLANMSHEIRTPMNGVLGSLELLLDSELTPGQRELGGLIQTSGVSLLRLINDILDLSKIEAGKLSIEQIPFDLLRVTEEVIEQLAPLAADKNLDLILNYAPELPHLLTGDPSRLRQILTNLLGNAIKFTERGHVALGVAAQAQDAETVSLRLWVEDTGIGIPADRLGQVFEKFTQADDSTTRRFGGTGLGLAINAQLVAAMGGQIGVDSIPGTGSTFWVTLRLPWQPEPPPPPPPIDLTGVRVLVVDDNAINRHVLHKQLLGWHMRPDECASAAEALPALRAAQVAGDAYRIAILDYQMPDVDGEMLGRAIKADPALADTVLLLLTSLGLRGDGARFKTIGFAAYLGKPVRQVQLQAALAAVWSAHVNALDLPLVTRHTLVDHRALSPEPSSVLVSGAYVLLAEDHPTNQVIASMMLRNLGCVIDIAHNGREAVEMAAHSDYDLVLMDCAMPIMDGFEATAEIRRRDDARGRVPIIAVTAQAMQGDRERCLEAGMDDYISKPLQSAALAAALRRWGPGRQATRVVAAAANRAPPPAAAGADADANAPTRAAALDAAVIANLRSLAQATDGNLLEQIFSSFRGDSVERIAALREAMRGRDADALRKAAHALKGASGSVGARHLGALAQQLEALGASGSVDDAARLIEQLQEEFTQVDSEMSACIGSHAP